MTAAAARIFPGFGIFLLLSACAGESAKMPGGANAASETSGTSVQMTSKPPVDPNVSTTLDVSLADAASASPGAQAAAAAIGQRIASCWKAAEAPDAPAVVLLLTFAEDGSVTAVETVDKRRFAGEPAYRAAASVATRAVFKCAPFALAAEEYVAWKSLAINLTPRHL
jgi:hypothetical protein